MFLGSPHISGLPRHGFARNKYVDLEDYLKLERFHHYYYRGKTSTQFCAVWNRSEGDRNVGSNKRKKADDYTTGQKVGGEIDLYKDGILKLVQAVSADKREYAARLAKEKPAEWVELWFYYPVFVTSGSLYECFIGKRGVPRYRGNAQLIVEFE